MGMREAALIDEAVCIGCTKCIQVCPDDAILGAAKQMHTILTEYCTGCGDCLPACPVDCIAIVDSPIAMPQQNNARRREIRLATKAEQKRQQDQKAASLNIKKAIDDCVARAKAKQTTQWKMYESA